LEFRGKFAQVLSKNVAARLRGGEFHFKPKLDPARSTAVQALRARGFSAPAIFASDREAGLLVIEDLGDELVVQDDPSAPIEARYEAATDLLARGAGEEQIREFEAALGLGKPHALKENLLLDSQGRSRWFQWSITPLRGVDGTITEVACVGFEITEQRMLREQYLQALKLDSIGRLAGGIAHDFNNLLTVITAHSGFLLDSIDEHEDGQRKDVEAIEHAALRAASLTQQLLAFGRKQVLQPRIVDLNTIVVDTHKMLRRMLGEHIEVVTALGSDLGDVQADPGQVEQVLVNLALNARDAMSEGGTLTITTANADPKQMPANAATGPFVVFSVTDSGHASTS
jgi:signal transduction histidine kinase